MTSDEEDRRYGFKSRLCNELGTETGRGHIIERLEVMGFSTSSYKGRHFSAQCVRCGELALFTQDEIRAMKSIFMNKLVADAITRRPN